MVRGLVSASMAKAIARLGINSHGGCKCYVAVEDVRILRNQTSLAKAPTAGDLCRASFQKSLNKAQYPKEAKK